MSQTIRCPACNSSDVIFSKKRQVHICEDCEYEFINKKEFTPKRIFISYGRDEYALLAENLKKDLSARGHEVWFDRDMLKDGSDWEQYIDAGLDWVSEDPENGRIVFIMTPHSVRRPDGYCLNEIAKALTKSVPIVPVMLVFCEPPLSIYRLQYLDMQDCFPPDEKTVSYEKQLERLILALEEKKLDFEGVQSLLLKTLEPISFAADLSKLLKDFTGRQWIFEEIDRWIENAEGEKFFWITGAPGVGKSAIAAWVRDNRREIAAFHFCDIYSEEKRDPCKLVRSIAYQLSTQLPAYEERLKGLSLEDIVREYHEAYTLFDKLLIQPLSENFPRPDRTVVILVDALDEATYHRINEIAEFLSRSADKTPPWLRFLVTSRPEPEIRSALQSLTPYMLDTSTDKNRLDITDYLRRKRPHITDEQIEALLVKSGGIFLYIRYVCDEIQKGRLSLERLEEFPQGLGDVYHQYFNRQFGKDLTYYETEIRPLLCLILASFEPLELGFLMQTLGYKNKMELFDRINRLGSLFPCTGDQEIDTISPFHRSVADWITVNDKAGPYYIDAIYGQSLLAEHGWRQYELSPASMDGYSLQWLPEHLAQINAHEKLIRLLKDFNYMMVKLKSGMLDRLLEDYFKTIKTIPSEHRRHFRIEEVFFRERAHILRRGNKDWPAYKILLQLAVEHADSSPITHGAEQYLSEGKCEWLWLRRDQRMEHPGTDPCKAVLEGHMSGVLEAVELSDGRILSWSDDHTMRLWDREGQPLSVLEGHKGRVFGAIELSDGRILSWSFADNTLSLRDREGPPLVLAGHTNQVCGAVELNDGRILSWSWDKTLRLWDREGHPLAVLAGHKRRVNGVAELRDGRILSWSKDKTLRLWNKEGDPLTVLAEHMRYVNGAVEISEGRILSWSDDETLRLWDKEGLPLAVLMEHTGVICGAAELSGGRILSWSYDETLRLWDREGHPLSVLEGHEGMVFGAIELSDGRILSWADETLRLWDREGHPLAVLAGHTRKVFGAIELSDGRILSWADKTLRLWDREGHPLAVLAGHTRKVFGAIELSDGRILSWSDDKTLRVWDRESQSLTDLAWQTDEVLGVVELRDNRILSWSWAEKKLRFWDMEGQPLADLPGQTHEVLGAVELSDGRILSWADETLRLWDREGQPIADLEEHEGMVLGAVELSDGGILSWSGDGDLRLWGWEGQLLSVLSGHTKVVIGAIELSNGGILSWAWDGDLRLWDKKGLPLAVLMEHMSAICGAVEFSGGRILSWSYDETLRLWDREGHPLAVLSGHTDAVRGAIELNDGQILSWSDDKTLRLWNREGRPLVVLAGHTGAVCGVVELRDGRLLSLIPSVDVPVYDNSIQSLLPKNTVRLWSRDGEALAVHDRSEVMWLYPEARKAVLGEQCCISHTWLDAAESASVLYVSKHHHKTSIVWHGISKIMPRLLKSDGRAVVTQDNGQVCFLKLYHGNKRIHIDELEFINMSRSSGDA